MKNLAAVLDLRSVEVLDIAKFELDVPSAHQWPCPGCGNNCSLADAWAMKVRNLTGPQLERAVVVCTDCLADADSTVTTSQAAQNKITVSQPGDAARALLDRFDTDSVDLPLVE